MLRGDIVKDDSGSCAVFAEQGSSASQMTAPKVMDIISRLPGCARQAADAVSVHTQVKNGGCSKTSENSQIRMSGCMDTSSETNGRRHGKTLKIPLFLLNETCTDTHSQTLARMTV